MEPAAGIQTDATAIITVIAETIREITAAAVSACATAAAASARRRCGEEILGQGTEEGIMQDSLMAGICPCAAGQREAAAAADARIFQAAMNM